MFADFASSAERAQPAGRYGGAGSGRPRRATASGAAASRRGGSVDPVRVADASAPWRPTGCLICQHGLRNSTRAPGRRLGQGIASAGHAGDAARPAPAQAGRGAEDRADDARHAAAAGGADERSAAEAGAPRALRADHAACGRTWSRRSVRSLPRSMSAPVRRSRVRKEGQALLKTVDDSLNDQVMIGAVSETEHDEIVVYEGLITTADGRTGRGRAATGKSRAGAGRRRRRPST